MESLNSGNPDQEPAAGEKVAGVRIGRQANLLDMAKRLRAVNCCILIQFVCLGAICFGIGSESSIVVIVLCVVYLTDVAVGGTVGLLLAMKVFHPLIGVLLGLTAWFPWLGLVSLLLISGKTCSVLEGHGATVGWFGVIDDTPNANMRSERTAD